MYYNTVHHCTVFVSSTCQATNDKIAVAQKESDKREKGRKQWMIALGPQTVLLHSCLCHHKSSEVNFSSVNRMQFTVSFVEASLGHGGELALFCSG